MHSKFNVIKTYKLPTKTIALELGSQQIADFQSATNLQQGRAIKNGKLLICTDEIFSLNQDKYTNRDFVTPNIKNGCCHGCFSVKLAKVSGQVNWLP